MSVVISWPNRCVPLHLLILTRDECSILAVLFPGDLWAIGPSFLVSESGGVGGREWSYPSFGVSVPVFMLIVVCNDSCRIPPSSEARKEYRTADVRGIKHFLETDTITTYPLMSITCRLGIGSRKIYDRLYSIHYWYVVENSLASCRNLNLKWIRHSLALAST